MANSAAIFDLDRTLVGGATGPILTKALRQVGLVSDRHIPGEDLLYLLFNVVGENRPSMFLTRQAARLAKGWPREAAREAGKIAAEELIERIQPYAAVLIEQHRAEGRTIAIATTTPYDMVKPLAEVLGIEDVIATRYGVRNGSYDGTIDGHFVWGKGKLAEVREWAARRRIDLRQSYAYSDSFYDVPLLRTVGHPVVVNPDPRMRLMAVARRWPTVYLDVPPGVPKLAGIEPVKALMPFAIPELILFADIDVVGADKIPAEGPAIVCGNHRSYFDVTAMGYLFAQSGRAGRFLGKKEVFDVPVVGDLMRAMGGIRVERGTGSDEPLREAALALEAGEVVTIMPQGTIPRGRAFYDPELKGRWGTAKLAAMTGAPVIPVGLWGTEKVWPRNSRLPKLWNVAHPPKVTVRVGEPVELSYDDPEKDTERIMQAIMDLLPYEARLPHDPTPEEIALAMPPGKEHEAADPAFYEHEMSRRPGTD
jgi:putative phosphoserine phosphatase / 1-acylglycerol-3-phosphate O-acyltransferase